MKSLSVHLLLLAAAILVIPPLPSLAQTQATPAKPATAATTAKPAASAPPTKPGAAAAPAQRQAAPKSGLKPGADSAPAQSKSLPSAAKPAPKTKPDASDLAAAKNLPTKAQPALLGQYENWGAYWAAPDGRKICFVAARPNGAQPKRTPTYMFVTSRPHDKVKDEVSAIVPFPLKSNADASATVGGKHYAMAAKADGVWIKNAADETKMLEAMRKGGELVLKGTTDRGLQSTDTFSLKGLAQALDRIARECK
jgi:Invasion associated locus B (IalB) protein